MSSTQSLTVPYTTLFRSHVIPKTLTAQGGRAQRKEPDQNCIPIPDAELAFAGRGQRPVEGGKKEVLAHRRSLVSFAGMGVDSSNDVQLLRCVPECCGGTEIPLLSVEGTSRSLGKAFEQLLCGTEMAHDADARPSTLIAKGFDDAPVAVPVDGVGLQARHDSYIHNLESVVNGRHNGLWCGFCPCK